MLRLVLLVLATAAGLYAAACAALWIAQERLVFAGGPPATTTPKDHGLPGEALFLKTDDDVRLYAWLVPAERPRGAVLVLHGNAGNVENRAEHARAFHELGFTTLLLDWRGYGASDGRTTEEGTYLDATAGYEYLVRALRFEPGQIAVFGESMGGGPAVELALRKPFGALILQSTFTSIPDVGARFYPWLPVRQLARVRYANLEKLPRVPMPVLLLHSREDELVPYAHAEALLAAALPPKSLVTTAGKHDDAQFFLREEWKTAVGAALNNMLHGKAPR
ncbi:MAG: alpha/beta fold hydrolase [Planctomycetes bacterium]|nr:alpha/beta fold hydrolase [Planctomycetota bacterium]